MHHVRGCKVTYTVAGEPGALKGARRVRRGAHEKGPFARRHLVGCLPYSYQMGVRSGQETPSQAASKGTRHSSLG